MSATTCRLIGCNGLYHDEGLCEIALDTIDMGGATPLNVTVNAYDGKPVELAVWPDMSDELLRTYDQATGLAFAARLRAFADAVEQGANLLIPAAPVAKPEPVDHAARFAALDSDVLFALEDAEDTSAPQAYIESLLIVLAEWRPRVLALLADAPEWAVPEAAAYRRALDRTREALVQWEFRYEGGPVLPYPFDVPEPVASVSVTDANVARITSAGRRDLTVRGVAA